VHLIFVWKLASSLRSSGDAQIFVAKKFVHPNQWGLLKNWDHSSHLERKFALGYLGSCIKLWFFCFLWLETTVLQLWLLAI